MTEREVFEKWRYDFAQREPRPPNEWDAWQASRKQALTEAVDLCMSEGRDGKKKAEIRGSYFMCADAIRSLTPPGEAA